MNQEKIEKLLTSMPNSDFFIDDLEMSCFFLKKEGNSKFLYCINIEHGFDFADEIKIIDIDFSKQSYRPLSFDEKNGYFYILSDESNKENFNIYRINIHDGVIEKVTESNYIQSLGFSDDKSVVYVQSRYHHDDNGYNSKLMEIDLKSLKSRELYDDCNDEYKMTWSEIFISEDNSKLLFKVDYKSKRDNVNFAILCLESLSIEKALPPSAEDSLYHLYFLNNSNFKDVLFYCSGKGEYIDLYSINLITKEVKKQVGSNWPLVISTRYKDNLNLFELGWFNYKEDKTELCQFELQGNQLVKLRETSMKGRLGSYEASSNIFIYKYLIDSPPVILKVNKKHEVISEFNLSKLSKEEMVFGSYKFLEYKTFDGHEVPAYFLKPKGELKGVLITSFYGGANVYSANDQIYLMHGYGILSPGVRGTSNYSTKWRNKICGDLGGDEILDVVWAAKYLMEVENIPQNKIGVKGGSHGGYATLRLLTMPDNFKGHESKFPFSFGICEAGFADLEDFYKTSNIPDWLTGMLGEYEENIEKYKDRSPVNHMEKLEAPLLIIHGKNDSRVKFSSIEGLIEKLKTTNVPHSILISEAMGHGTQDLSKQVKEWKVRLNFLDKYC